jgi:Sulfotransferase domain
VLVTARRGTASKRPLPDFVILGAQKAGTSSLYARLVAHPCVLPALRKEVHYFDTGAPTHPDRYRAFFPTESRRAAIEQQSGAPALTGEATPYYLFHPSAPARAHSVVPDARLIAVLRDPVARAVSGYHHAVRFGHERRPIEIALDPGNEERLANVADDGWFDERESPARLRGYLARGRYAEQLERWWASFPREQLLVIESAELRAGDGFTRVLAFLGLDEAPGGAVTPDRNVGSYAPPPLALIDRLGEYFAPHNARLFAILGEQWDWPA